MGINMRNVATATMIGALLLAAVGCMGPAEYDEELEVGDDKSLTTVTIGSHNNEYDLREGDELTVIVPGSVNATAEEGQAELVNAPAGMERNGSSEYAEYLGFGDTYTRFLFTVRRGTVGSRMRMSFASTASGYERQVWEFYINVYAEAQREEPSDETPTYTSDQSCESSEVGGQCFDSTTEECSVPLLHSDIRPRCPGVATRCCIGGSVSPLRDSREEDDSSDPGPTYSSDQNCEEVGGMCFDSTTAWCTAELLHDDIRPRCPGVATRCCIGGEVYVD